MKRVISLVLFAAVLFSLAAHAEEPVNTLPEERTSDKVILCFSATDNTWGIAEKIAAAVDADILRIEAEIPYTEDDLNWHDRNCRANREQNDSSARPGIANLPESLDGYDTVFIGYPIWWGTIPRIIRTLMEAYNWEGKTVVPFCTSGSSGIETSIRDLKAMDSGAEVLDTGRRFPAGASEQNVREWLNEIGY